MGGIPAAGGATRLRAFPLPPLWGLWVIRLGEGGFLGGGAGRKRLLGVSPGMLAFLKRFVSALT